MDAQTLFNQGREHFSRGQWAEAAASYEAAARAQPTAGVAWGMAGIALTLGGRPADGLLRIDAGLKASPQNADLWSYRTYTLNLLKRYAEGLHAADKCVALNPAHADGWNNRGISLQCLGTEAKKFDQLQEALRCFAKALEISPKHPRAAENKERVVGQIRSVQELENKIPENAADWIARAANYTGDEAVRCIDKALELDPVSIDAWFAKASYELAAGRLDAGARAMEEFLKISAAARNERVTLAEKLLVAMRRDGVFWHNDLPEGLTVEAMSRAAQLSNEAEAHIKEGVFKEAAEKSLEAVKLNPHCGSGWMNAGYSLDELGRIEEALAAYDKGLTLLPQETSGWLNRGTALHRLGRLEEAEASQAKGCELGTPEKGAWIALAKIRATLKRWDAAVEAYEKALVLFPNDYELVWGRLKLLNEAGREKQSMDELFKAMKDPVFAARWEAEDKRLFESGTLDPAPAPVGPGDHPEIEARREGAVATGGAADARPSSASASGGTADGAEFKPGDVIGGKYEVAAILGMGGMGVVYKVYSRESKAVYALKTFRAELLADAKARDMFKEEAQVWLDLGRHPFVVRANFFDELHGRFYLAVELVAGPAGEPSDLQGWVERGPVPLERLLRWGIQFCHGMEHAHARGVRAHKDIKPANVLVASDGTLKISDFGLAGVLGGATSTDAGVFATGLALSRAGDAGGAGTPPYMPPEQWRSMSACDARSDVYAFGIMLFQLAAGRLPFLPSSPRRNAQEMNHFILELRALHEHEPMPPLEGPLEPVARRCLEKDPIKRYQGFAELRADLEPLLLAATGETVALPERKSLESWEWNNRGISLNDLGRFSDSLECFDKALALDPGNARSISNRSLALNGLGRHGEALEWAEKALAADPDELTAWNNKGCALLDLGYWDQADQAFEQALARNPRHLDALNNRGYALIANKRYADAVTAFDRALIVEPRAPTAWNNKGAALDKMGQADAAVACYEKSLELDPFQHMAWMNIGIILRRAKNYTEALRRYAKCLELKPDYAPAWFNKGIAEEEMGRFADALASFKKFLEKGGGGPALAEQQAYAKNRLPDLEQSARKPAAAPAKLGPSPADPFLEQAGPLLQHGNFAEALPLLQKAVAVDPAKWPVWANIAQALASLGRGQEALAAIDRAVALAPERDGPWMIKAGILTELGRLEESLACFDRALAIEPKASPTLGNKAALLNRMKRPEEALVLLVKALEVDPNNFVAWLNRAHTEKGLGRRDEALRSFQEFIRVCPTQNAAFIAEARDEIASLERGSAPVDDAQVKDWFDAAQILLNQNQLERALANLDKVLAARPHNGEAWALKAETLSRLGRGDESIRCWEEAVRNQPTRVDFWVKRGLDLSNLKRYDKAIASFDSALKLQPDTVPALNGKGMALFQMAYSAQLAIGVDMVFKDPVLLAQIDQAFAQFDLALKFDPQHPLARYNRSTVLDLIGRRDEAAVGYRQFLANAPIQYKAMADKVRERLKALGGLG